ncbi:hypothetical protein [Nocardia wallacei]|uniref:hypothetical protein n=1 Tax=Nocardia wallacei TaxID=480035 RepID=UPI0024556A6A|nr:hypothetical protein [Nocardia wallacei]
MAAANTPRKTAPKTAKPAEPVEAVEAEAPKSRWATMRDEARANHKPVPPYEFDGTEPPTLITAPDSADRVTALAQLLDGEGDVAPGDIRRLFEVVCGPAFDAVWRVVGPEPFEVLFPLFRDINNHFQAVPAEDGDDLPGGA